MESIRATRVWHVVVALGIWTIAVLPIPVIGDDRFLQEVRVLSVETTGGHRVRAEVTEDHLLIAADNMERRRTARVQLRRSGVIDLEKTAFETLNWVEGEIPMEALLVTISVFPFSQSDGGDSERDVYQIRFEPESEDCSTLVFDEGGSVIGKAMCSPVDAAGERSTSGDGS